MASFWEIRDSEPLTRRPLKSPSPCIRITNKGGHPFRFSKKYGLSQRPIFDSGAWLIIKNHENGRRNRTWMRWDINYINNNSKFWHNHQKRSKIENIWKKSTPKSNMRNFSTCQDIQKISEFRCWITSQIGTSLIKEFSLCSSNKINGTAFPMRCFLKTPQIKRNRFCLMMRPVCFVKKNWSKERGG